MKKLFVPLTIVLIASFAHTQLVFAQFKSAECEAHLKPAMDLRNQIDALKNPVNIGVREAEFTDYFMVHSQKTMKLCGEPPTSMGYYTQKEYNPFFGALSGRGAGDLAEKKFKCQKAKDRAACSKQKEAYRKKLEILAGGSFGIDEYQKRHPDQPIAKGKADEDGIIYCCNMISIKRFANLDTAKAACPEDDKIYVCQKGAQIQALVIPGVADRALKAMQERAGQAGGDGQGDGDAEP